MRIPLLVAFILTAIIVHGQEADDLQFKLKDYQLSSEHWSDIYPDLHLKGVGASGGDDWVRFAVQFELSDPKAKDEAWVDQLTATWNIVLANGRRSTSNPQPEYSVRFKRSVHYVHVKTSDRGETYWVMIYLPPEVMERYGADGRMLPDDYIMGRLDLTRGHHHVGTVWFRGDDADSGDRPSSSTLASYMASEDPAIVENTLFHRLETPWNYSGSDNAELMRLHPGTD